MNHHEAEIVTKLYEFTKPFLSLIGFLTLFTVYSVGKRKDWSFMSVFKSQEELKREDKESMYLYGRRDEAYVKEFVLLIQEQTRIMSKMTERLESVADASTKLCTQIIQLNEKQREMGFQLSAIYSKTHS